MNILVLTYEYPPIGGGAGRVVQALAEVWSARGNTVSILTSGEKGQTGIDLNESVRIIRVAAGRSSVFDPVPDKWYIGHGAPGSTLKSIQSPTKL